MPSPPVDPTVDDVAATAFVLTAYDQRHVKTYLRLLDAGAHWKDVARIVLRIDPRRDPRRARRAWETHLARARLMTMQGYQHLLHGGPPH
jgi:hypothetical protein